MLSENQKEIVINQVNAETDIPFMRESTESRIISKIVETLNPHIEPSLRSLCPAPYVDCLKLALQEGVPIEEKRLQISEILRGELAEPLADKLAGVLDVAMVPEEYEGRILAVVTQKLVEEMVEWCVGEIDERTGERLSASREIGS